jgi:Arc/MetJ family transcription regulator
MKISLNIDDALLSRVMDSLGTRNKTRAIDLALREIDRRGRLQKLAAQGMGLSPDELESMFDPAYDLESARIAEGSGLYRTGKSNL